MSADMAGVQGQLSFWRIVDIPFEAFAAALDSRQRAGQGGQFRVGRNQLSGQSECDRDTGECLMQVRLARGRLRPARRMRLAIDRWSATSTAVELIPCRLVRPTAAYFDAGHLFLDSLTRSLS